MKSFAMILSALVIIGFMAMPAPAGANQHPFNGHMMGYTTGHMDMAPGGNNLAALRHQLAVKQARIQTLKAQPNPDWNRIDALTLDTNHLQSRIQTIENLRGLSEPDFFYGCYAARNGYKCP